jgi:recombination protein RecR
LTFFLLNAPDELSRDLAESIQNLKSNTAYCQVCFNITVAGRNECEICANPDRDPAVVCVVEEPLDVIAIERTDGFQGRYHVLHGALSPIEGIGPDDLKIRQLMERVRKGGIREVILATNPSMEGDATAMYLRQQIQPHNVRITRLARGLPVGGDLEYADQSTLLRALAGRQEMG